MRKNYGKDTLWDYLDKFNANTAIGNCRGDDACLTPLLSPIMNSFSIDKSKIDSCMASDAEALYNADGARASSLGVSGSPTLIINGVDSQASRSPDAVKTLICSAFNEVPSECSQTLSTSQASAGFGSDISSDSTSASCN